MIENKNIRCEWGFTCTSKNGLYAIVEPGPDGNIECEADGAFLCAACKLALEEINS